MIVVIYVSAFRRLNVKCCTSLAHASCVAHGVARGLKLKRGGNRTPQLPFSLCVYVLYHRDKIKVILLKFKRNECSM